MMTQTDSYNFVDGAKSTGYFIPSYWNDEITALTNVTKEIASSCGRHLIIPATTATTATKASSDSFYLTYTNYTSCASDYFAAYAWFSYDSCTLSQAWWQEDHRQKIRDIIKSRISPAIHVKRKSIVATHDVAEVRARETLQRVLGNAKFRQFIKNGFVTVTGKSGKIYKIHPGHEMTVVYEKGIPVQKLCVVLQGTFPPTDSLIMRYLMLLNNEDAFVAKANKFSADKSHASAEIDQRPLTTIMAGLRRVA